MADNVIEIVASLDIPKSVSTIGSDLKQVTDRINSNKGLKITCNIDLSKTTHRIQSQLAAIGKNFVLNIPKITFGADTSGVQNSAKKAADGANQAKNEIVNITHMINSAVDDMKSKLAKDFNVDADKIITDFSKSADGKLSKVALTITKATGEIEKFKYSIKGLNAKGKIELTPISSSGTDRGRIQTFAKAAKEADNLEIRLQSLQAKFTDINASKPILQAMNQEALAAEYEKAINAVNALRKADASTYQQMEYNAKSAINNYNNLAIAMRNAETAATDMRSKPIDVIQAEQIQKLEQFISKIASSGIKDISSLTAEIERLKTILSKPLSASELKSYLNDFAKITAQFQSLKQQSQAFSSLESQINNAISSLNNQSGTSLFRSNITESNVMAQITAIDDLRNKYRSLLSEFQNAQTPESFVAVQQKLVELSPLFEKVTADTQNLKQVLSDNKAMASFTNNIAKTESSMNKFAAANQRAVNSLKKMSNGNTFQQNWQQMLNSLKDPNLNAEKLKQINQQFQIFRNEASAAGLTSSSFFKGMANQIQMVAARWFSLYTVIGKTKEMINNVINLDNAMTNLKRVTDETAASYEDFLELSNKIAKDTHTTMTDAVEQAARWAKAGYDDPAEAAELAKTSLIYSVVGDVDNETAVNDMVTAIKGFNIEAENAIEIIDKLDILNNNYATNAKSLGEGLSKSASAMSAANNTLDETLALLTGGTEITQNAAEMGASLKVISMRIRGMRGDLEKLGEEYENIESISKIQTQILNLTNGKVNIFDSNDNFRSTYDILKDISEVIDDLSDPDRADLTEILFGKMRANQGLAIVNAFQSGRIKEIMADINESAGTAIGEIDKYGESVTAHITEFKNQWQKFSNDFLSSGFLKNAVDSGTKLVEILDKLVNGVGALGTAITAIVGISAFKGVGIFGNSTNGLTGIKKRFSEITDVVRTAVSIGDISNTYKMFNISLNGLSNNDITALQKYVNLMNSGTMSSVAFKKTMVDSSKNVKIQAKSLAMLNQAYRRGEISSQEYTAATKNLSAVQKTATATSTALSIGLNLLTNVGISLAISFIIKLIVNLTTAEERAAEKNREYIESVRESINKYKEEENFLQGVINKYTELYVSTNDINSIKKDLISLQDEIVDKYGEEASVIDLLNGKYSDNIKLLNQERLANAKKFLEDNAAQIRDAEKAQTEKQKGVSSIIRVKSGERYISALREYADNHDSIDYYSIRNELTGNTQYGFDLKSDTIDEQIQALNELAEYYKNLDGFSTKYYNKIIEKREELIELQKTNNELLEDAAKNERIVAEIEIPDDVRSEFDTLIDNAKQLNQTMQGDGTAIERYAASQKLESLKKEIYQLAGANTELKNEANTVFATFETGASNVITSMADIEKEFYESLDGVQKDSLKNVELIENAMQTLANGKYVSWENFWNIKELDTDGAIFRPEQIGNELKINIQQLQQVKDSYIKPIIESLKNENQAIKDQIDSTNGVTNGLKDQLEYELLILDAQIAKGINSSGDEKRLNEQKKKIQEIRDNIKSYGEQIKRNNLLIDMWNAHLGDTVDKTEMLNEQLKKVQSLSDNYAKAMTAKIDSIINSHESEKDALENEKEVLNEQLDILEEQQKAIEDIIDNYKTIVDIVGDATDNEIDILKEQQEAEKNAIQAKIDALKEEREQQEEENTLTEKQIALQEKLRDLEKAHQTKVRTYSSERGWHFDVDKESVANAQTAADNAQADYDKAVDDKAYNDQLSNLEKEKDLVSKNFEEQIKAYEDYYNQWKSILDEQTKAENEQIAQQILGAEWREKIKNKDTEILNRFKSNFQGYNTQLNNLINNEIANLKLSIKAKEDEIKAKENQIQSWKDYKTQVENSINSIKDKYEEYVDFLNQIELDENSSYEDRERALANFVGNYQGYIDEIQSIQAQLSDASVDIYINTNIPQISEEMANFIESYREGIEAMQRSLEESVTGYGIVSSAWDAKLANAANALRGYANGGTVDYTGVAAVHGSKKSAEVVFNAAQSKQLYDMVMKGEFADLAAAKAAEGFASVLKSIESSRTFNKNISNTNNSNTSSVVIQHMDINGVQNPAEFANEFNKNMKQYLQNVYVESLVK